MAQEQKRSLLITLLPIALFISIAAVFFVMLTSSRDPSEIPSALVGKQMPDMSLSALEGAQSNGVPIPAMSSSHITDPAQNKGRVIIVNIWASWCAPCRQEHPFLMSLSSRNDILIAGINYKDQNAQAIKFLAGLGNPYEIIGVDPNGRAAIDLGVYGVPETFIVSARGVITYKHVGPIVTEEDQRKFLQKITEAHGK